MKVHFYMVLGISSWVASSNDTNGLKCNPLKDVPERERSISIVGIPGGTPTRSRLASYWQEGSLGWIDAHVEEWVLGRRQNV